jgi:hypothetical protein
VGRNRTARQRHGKIEAKTEEDRMVLFISGALFGLILGLTVSAYAAGIFGTGRPG